MWTIFTIWMAWHQFWTITSGAQECRQLEYSLPIQGKTLENHVIIEINIPREDMCQVRCYIEPSCLSFNVGPLENNDHFLCQISDSDEVLHPGDLVQRLGFTYQGTQSPCSTGACVNNSTCQAGYTSKGYRCICPAGFSGLSCNQDFNECTSSAHDCHVNAACINTVGSFDCICGLGYTGNGRECTAINDCSEVPQTTGIYHILNHGLDPFPVYCDQASDEGGWTMVFKVVGGALPETVGQLWRSTDAHSENVTDALDTTTTFFGQYKNRIVMDWQTFQPQEARVVFYENGVEVISLKFNATGTDNWNWFSQTNLISSPWNDLKTSLTARFGIIGPIVDDRYFEFSSKPYAGCATDSAWMIVTHHPVCAWDKRSPHPSIQYSKLATKAILNEFAHVGVADVLAVYVR